ncbi:hypothetical protein QJS10_CPA09g00936 [Acorus calamus]|uniref:Uncharacterized protein n=1 Tax=Acorus calamus TaxID=4465 RepID=A0AAV9E7E1_ACOCL|nr:hypothetical protein QJS10_CPA09g00936 [Acorus calamus]
MGHSKFPTTLLEKTTVASSALAVYETVISAVGLVGKGEEETVDESPISEEATSDAAEVILCVPEKGKRRMGEIAEEQMGEEKSRAAVSKGKKRSKEAVATKACIPKGKECIYVEAAPDVSIGRSVFPPSGGNKEAEEGRWQKVQGRSRRSRDVPESSRRGPIHFKGVNSGLSLRSMACFRYLGRGHLARDCHDPP